MGNHHRAFEDDLFLIGHLQGEVVYGPFTFRETPVVQELAAACGAATELDFYCPPSRWPKPSRRHRGRHRKQRR